MLKKNYLVDFYWEFTYLIWREGHLKKFLPEVAALVRPEQIVAWSSITER